MLLSNYKFFFATITLGFIGFFTLGCSGSNGDLGQVSGVVTIDGVPADRATVRFYPSNGRGSFAETDSEGNYELVYKIGKTGARIGTHKVTISTMLNPEMSTETMQQIAPGRKESLPARYYDRRKTELSETVKAGQNEINFELTTAP